MTVQLQKLRLVKEILESVLAFQLPLDGSLLKKCADRGLPILDPSYKLAQIVQVLEVYSQSLAFTLEVEVQLLLVRAMI